ncbi:HD domain-containing protein [Sporomusa acidovorans]|uniref:HD domain-containing protein n=1 Tax=Sporomusa acidovorans (strain ATCC 49682 / DSM 3132 / Mol) TaxID=1123286 RepID=A0ABZ3J7K0_SPOA4|nr:HD domain-containing protein [Sporomusa acidovorans]OZC16633.1 HD domain protein [Sporomusa acidovorans DSM 3132]SDE07631.1 HD domain-containing protein [Sporomusa acidovorans]
MNDLCYLYEWLGKYIKGYYTDDTYIMERVLLKEKHSRAVAENSVQLADWLALTGRQRKVAEVIGLFHDLARFRQVTEYRTFVDSDSFDHGDVGAALLAETGIIKDFSEPEQATVDFAIRIHNKMLIPSTTPENELMAKIIRDADKLDIFRILPPVAANHDYSPKMLEQLKIGGCLSYTDVKTMADKRLIRLSWFYDINFDWTLRQLVAEGQLNRQLAALPDTAECSEIKANMQAYIAGRLNKQEDM